MGYFNATNLGYLDEANNAAYGIRPQQGYQTWGTPQSAVKRGLVNNFVNPMPIQDNSSVIGVGQGSQSQALGMMNTPGVGTPTQQKGFFGREFGALKSDVLGNAEGQVPGVQQVNQARTSLTNNINSYLPQSQTPQQSTPVNTPQQHPVYKHVQNSYGNNSQLEPDEE